VGHVGKEGSRGICTKNLLKKGEQWTFNPVTKIERDDIQHSIPQLDSRPGGAVQDYGNSNAPHQSSERQTNTGVGKEGAAIETVEVVGHQDGRLNRRRKGGRCR